MTSIKLIVTGASARAEVDGYLTAGMVGVPVTIQYDSDWDGLTKTLVCRGGGICYSSTDVVKAILNVANEATVAPDVMIAGRSLYLGVEGRNSDGTLVIPTVWAYCGKIQSSANVDADPSTDPALPVWAQLLNAMGNLALLNTETKENLVAAINEALTKGGGTVDETAVQQIVTEYLTKNPAAPGEDGATFTPYVSNDGDLSWSNDKGLKNPSTVNIRGAPGDPGSDGVTPHIGENGNWYVGETDTGIPSRGVQGEPGEDGISPTVSVSAIEGGNRITITDVEGTKTVDVMDGADGQDGKDGEDGNGIKSAVLNADFTLTLTFDDGTSYTTPSIRGATGDKGDTGEKGEKGDAFTYDDFTQEQLASLKGEPGYTPQKGIDYTDGTSVTVSSVSESTEDGGSNVVTFSDGKKLTVKNGKTGANGVSPEVSVSKSGKATTITITDASGTKTATINDGADGQDGKDATDADAVPAYWQTALDEGVEAINTALCEAGRNKSAFLFYSDAHWNYGSQMSPTLLKYLYRYTGMTKTFFGGDIVNDEATDYDAMEYLWEWRKQLKDLPNHHSVVGNHDDGNSTNNLFSEQYVYGYLLGPEETQDVVRGDGMYYYVDSPAEKTRYLCLDTAYKGVTSTQTDFVKNALLTAPAGWHIVAVSHIWVDADYSVTPAVPGEISANGATLLAMFDSYNSRLDDYADCGGQVEFCIGGHTHWDYDTTSPNGIPVILVETDSKHVRSGLGFTAGTTTEASVNGIVADYDAKTVKVVRIGRGSSREVEINITTTELPTYTNALPISLAADGTSIYNADDTPGYKANTRWSQSGQAEQTQDGTYISGWIPIAKGDVIRLKNVNMLTSASTSIVFWSNGLGTTTGSAGASTLVSNASGVTDDDGNLTQFTVVGEYHHMRIQCAGFTAKSIVTINEPID